MNIARRSASPVSAYRPGARSVTGFDDQIGRIMESMFEDMLSPLMPFGRGELDNLVMPRLHIAETDQAFDVEAELPGVQKDDVKITVENRRVTIEAEEMREAEEKDGQKTLYSERSIRRYARTFTLPTEVDDEKAEAKLENGILRLNLPKKETSQGKKLTVQ